MLTDCFKVGWERMSFLMLVVMSWSGKLREWEVWPFGEKGECSETLER